MIVKPAKWVFADIYKSPAPGWKAEVATKLRQGFGAEDIAIWMGCKRVVVQTYIDEMRRDGLFKIWWPDATN